MNIKFTLAVASAALATTAIGLPAQAFSIGSSYTISGQGTFSGTSIDFKNDPVLESATKDFSSLNRVTVALFPGFNFKVTIDPKAIDIAVGGSGLLVDFEDSPLVVGTDGILQSFNTYDFTASTVTFLPSTLRYLFTGTFGDGTKGIGELAQLTEVDGEPGVFGYTATFRAVPTPALLPGLIGLGVAALRRKDDESAEENA